MSDDRYVDALYTPTMAHIIRDCQNMREWYKWFAWYPVEVKRRVEFETGIVWYDDEPAWLKWVERRRCYYSYGMEYREIGCDYDY